jgi:hypothetical protein
MLPYLLNGGTHPDTHIQHQTGVPLVGGIRVAHNVRGPFVLCSISVSRADVFVLERLELLLGTEFIGL